MAGWFSRLAVVVLSLLAAAFAGGAVLGAASGETQVTELLVTCLSCGEQGPGRSTAGAATSSTRA